ncbi:ArdC family protein [Methylobacterium oryzihabitans]|uniref:DUF1738 domain-containing protein n=1 Tax=Methylobacterium oryzihabitans TaxID=2499852 RepID=A0A3S2VM08_9HYPH|nr:zincin-like metallopeptidase domain-containing protein [Methylobacterium oryzihabitans]RVU11997.1 DUF1738 domain-containing protein [Methylobacterium oryzihabitans]
MSATDLHTRVAAIILAQLDAADPASWTPPWHGANPMPRNAHTGRRYRGLNVLALWCAAHTHGYADARWATYRQWAALGAQVRRAERGTLVLFYKELPHSARAEASDDNTADRAPFVARAAYVFNAAQVDTAPPVASASNSVAPPTSLPTFDTFVRATGARINEGGTRACYVPATDTIHLPPRATFHTPTCYAGTLAHELIHWTGAPHRLARDLTGRFGARAYAAEELTAELGAAFVLADLGIARTPHSIHAAYCASWAPLLRADPHALTHAATQASRAADYLTALQPDSREGTGTGDEACTPTPPASQTALPQTRKGPASAGIPRARVA